MPVYADYADYYDAFHSAEFDLQFYLYFARQCGSPILELGCGTGRLTIPLAEAGFEVHGADLSDNMLEICHQRVGEKGLENRVHLTLRDMAALDLPRKDFGLVFVALRSFMHLLTQGDQLCCPEGAYTHLRPGGCFLVDVYAPNFRHLAQKPGARFVLRRELDLPNGHHVIRRDRHVRNDIINQVQYTEIRFEECDSSGVPVHERETPLNTR
jgi:SAM-dependent methyltransferase